MRTPSFRDASKLLLQDSLSGSGLNEFKQNLMQDKDNSDKLGKSPEKGVPMHSISNELLSVPQNTLDHYNLLN
jgi:hypothetical protein